MRNPQAITVGPHHAYISRWCEDILSSMCLRITTIYKKNDKKFSEVENIYFHALQFNRSQVYQLEIYKNITFLFQIFKRFYNRFEKKKKYRNS